MITLLRLSIVKEIGFPVSFGGHELYGTKVKESYNKPKSWYSIYTVTEYRVLKHLYSLNPNRIQTNKLHLFINSCSVQIHVYYNLCSLATIF